MPLQLPVCKITAVFGPVASGKTHLLSQWLKTQNRVVVLDQTGEFLDDPTLQHVFSNPKQLATMLRDSPYYFRIAYEPGMDIEEDFSWVLKALWLTPSEKLLIVDEFHQLCPVNAANDEVKMMIRYARHDKLGFIGVSQRIADVHKLFTSCARMVVIFNTREARDIAAITERWGKDCADMVSNLRPLLHDDATGTTHQVPQCVVIELGKQPRIYDFAKDQYASGNENANDPGTVGDDGGEHENEASLSEDDPA